MGAFISSILDVLFFEVFAEPGKKEVYQEDGTYEIWRRLLIIAFSSYLIPRLTSLAVLNPYFYSNYRCSSSPLSSLFSSKYLFIQNTRVMLWLSSSLRRLKRQDRTKIPLHHHTFYTTIISCHPYFYFSFDPENPLSNCLCVCVQVLKLVEDFIFIIGDMVTGIWKVPLFFFTDFYVGFLLKYSITLLQLHSMLGFYSFHLKASIFS